MATKTAPTGRVQRAKEIPLQVQQVCKDMALARYDRHYHPRHKHHRKHVIADVLLGGLVLALLLFSAYIFFFYRSAVLREGIELSITLQDNVVLSGEGVNYTLSIRNFTGENLLDASVEFPDNGPFIVSSVTPARLNGNVVELGALRNEEVKELRVSGYVIAEVDQDIRLNAILRYHAGAFVRVDEKLTSESVQVTGSSLGLSFELPESLVANQPFPFKISYHNQSPVTNFDHVSLLPNWPPGFEVLTSSQPLSEDADFWTVNSIGSLEQGIIEGQAQLLTTDLEEAKITLRAFASPQGVPLLQKQVELRLPVRYPNVTAEAVSLQPVTASGEMLTYRVRFENNETFPLSGLVVKADTNLSIFDAASLPGARDESGKVTVLLADTVQPGERLEKDVTFKVRPLINARLAFGDGEALIRLPMSTHYQDANGQAVTVQIQAASTQLNSDLSAKAFARYYSPEGDQIGRGPVPPRVGETTKYWVFVHLSNQLHVVNDVVMTARLPIGLDWTGRKSMTEGRLLEYVEANRQIRWEIASIPDYKTDFTKANFGIAFEVAVTPTTAQVGETIRLLEEIEIQGRDAVTGQVVSTAPEFVTSELAQDSYAPGEGNVLP